MLKVTCLSVKKERLRELQNYLKDLINNVKTNIIMNVGTEANF